MGVEADRQVPRLAIRARPKGEPGRFGLLRLLAGDPALAAPNTNVVVLLVFVLSIDR